MGPPADPGLSGAIPRGHPARPSPAGVDVPPPNNPARLGRRNAGAALPAAAARHPRVAPVVALGSTPPDVPTLPWMRRLPPTQVGWNGAIQGPPRRSRTPAAAARPPLGAPECQPPANTGSQRSGTPHRRAGTRGCAASQEPDSAGTAQSRAASREPGTLPRSRQVNLSAPPVNRRPTPGSERSGTPHQASRHTRMCRLPPTRTRWNGALPGAAARSTLRVTRAAPGQPSRAAGEDAPPPGKPPPPGRRNAGTPCGGGALSQPVGLAARTPSGCPGRAPPPHDEATNAGRWGEYPGLTPSRHRFRCAPSPAASGWVSWRVARGRGAGGRVCGSGPRPTRLCMVDIDVFRSVTKG